MVEQWATWVGAPTIFAPRVCFSVSDFAQPMSNVLDATHIYVLLIREPESGLNLSRHPATIRDVRAEYPAAESPL
jgi:hypothetical protein